MSAQQEVDRAHGADAALKRAVRGMWALGDYHRFATSTVWELGALLTHACGIGPGQRVLDVAAGTGNTAIRAAEAGADVVASDLTPENFPAGQREAAARGVRLEWVEADAEALPFEDGEFDVVTSSFGAIFAPDHRAAANELLRVCRAGGIIGMVNFRADGLGLAFFELLGRWLPPPPPHAAPPLLWGDEAHVRALFGGHVERLELRRGEYIEHSAGGPDAYCSLFRETFGPIIAVRESLRGEPERLAQFDAELADYARRGARMAANGAADYAYPYLLVTARRA